MYYYGFVQLRFIFSRPFETARIIRTIRANLTNSKSFALNNIRGLVRDPHYDAKKPTVLYVHGWEENQTQPNVAVIPHSYDIRGGWNVILLDWDKIAAGNYTIVWYNSIQVSDSYHYLWQHE